MGKLFPDKKIDLPIDLKMAADIAATPPSPMTVGELIVHLRTYDPTLPVVYPLHSEYCILTEDEIDIKKAQAHRPDGWVHRDRNDRDAVSYLVIGE